MRFLQTRFVSAFVDPAATPKDRPALVLAGRSNVGKSTLVNRLAARTVAKTSKTPGRTRQLIYFAVETDTTPPFYLVDLPGYGYAAGPKAERDRFGRAARALLADRGRVKGVLQLVDVGVPWQDSDLEMLDWVLADRIPFALVLTKIDRVNRAAPAKHVAELARRMPWPKDAPVFATSGKDNVGIVGVRKWIEALLRAPAQRPGGGAVERMPDDDDEAPDSGRFAGSSS
jgi:GTP-binding protein